MHNVNLFNDPFLPLPFKLFASFVILAVISGFIFVFIQIGRSIARNAANAQAPFERRQARVVTKRTEVWGERSHTDYHVTFELDGGQRAEYETTGEQYGLLVEGDSGDLVTQGTAFRSFERHL